MLVVVVSIFLVSFAMASGKNAIETGKFNPCRYINRVTRGQKLNMLQFAKLHIQKCSYKVILKTKASLGKNFFKVTPVFWPRVCVFQMVFFNYQTKKPNCLNNYTDWERIFKLEKALLRISGKDSSVSRELCLNGTCIQKADLAPVLMEAIDCIQRFAPIPKILCVEELLIFMNKIVDISVKAGIPRYFTV